MAMTAKEICDYLQNVCNTNTYKNIYESDFVNVISVFVTITYNNYFSVKVTDLICDHHNMIWFPE